MALYRKSPLALLFVAILIIGLAGPALADGPRDWEAREIAENLACPICEGQSVAESKSQLAQQMRVVIEKKLEEGESREDILNYFVDRFGEGVLLAPRKSGFNQVLWWLPPVGLLLGAGVSLFVLRHWKANRRASMPPEKDLKEMTGQELARYQERLKQELEPES